jgi:hypothetical protein
MVSQWATYFRFHAHGAISEGAFLCQYSFVYHRKEGSDTWKRFLLRHLFLQQDQFMHATAESRCIHETLPPNRISTSIDMNSIHHRQLDKMYTHFLIRLRTKILQHYGKHTHFLYSVPLVSHWSQVLNSWLANNISHNINWIAARSSAAPTSTIKSTNYLSYIRLPKTPNHWYPPWRWQLKSLPKRRIIFNIRRGSSPKVKSCTLNPDRENTTRNCSFPSYTDVILEQVSPQADEASLKSL